MSTNSGLKQSLSTSQAGLLLCLLTHSFVVFSDTISLFLWFPAHYKDVWWLQFWWEEPNIQQLKRWLLQAVCIVRYSVSCPASIDVSNFDVLRQTILRAQMIFLTKYLVNILLFSDFEKHKIEVVTLIYTCMNQHLF